MTKSMELLNKVAEERKTKLLYTYSMDQITLKTPNPTGSLFLKIDMKRDLAAGVYLSDEAPCSPRFLSGVVKHCCIRFGICSNTQFITPVDALRKT